MNKRIPNSRITNECGFISQPRRNKKRNNRKNSSTNESWYNNDRDRDSHEPSEDDVPGMEYTSMFWQQPRLSQQPHPAHNGQRLFTAMSDPSVCGYSAVPVTYTMEPVSLPPMYRVYQPIVRPNYRPYRGRARTSLTRMQNGPPNSDVLGNGYSSLQENGWSHTTTPMTYQNGDYTSLPPTANVDNKDNRDELSSEHRRYSDPGLGPADLPTNSKSEDTASTDSGSSITTVGKSNKLFLMLIEQMTKMKETNSQLFRELHQAKSDVETVKIELNQFKQNVPLDYQPGMLSDIIKEIRDASRIREEAMLSKLKLLMDNQQSQRSIDLEQLKSQLDKVRREKEEREERVCKLEKEVAALKLSLNSEHREIAAFEEENLALRRELQEARASRNLAESHATKCVNAAVALGPVTPVNFDSPYSPCITSTPVRTTFASTSTDPSSSVASLRSTDVNHDLILLASTSTATSTSTSTSTAPSLLAGADQTTLTSDECQRATERLVLSTKEANCSAADNNSKLSKLSGGSCGNDSQSSSAACDTSEPDKANEGEQLNADDVPTEILVAGNSVVSNDLCSTNILTSRVLTAPSRATYTTAYI